MNLSIIIPVFNEVKTIEELIKKVDSFNDLEKEIIVVDDCSTDGTSDILKRISEEKVKINIISHSQNMGKGAAIQSALKAVKNDIIIIQDGDLEYDPKDYPKLLHPILNAKADVVFGSRFLGGRAVRVHLYWHYLANKILTTLTNIFTNMNFTDIETGYKVFKKSIINDIQLEEKSFGIEPEITIKLCKKKAVFFEVPISYYGRSYSEGKKIHFSDALKALFCKIKYSIFYK